MGSWLFSTSSCRIEPYTIDPYPGAQAWGTCDKPRPPIPHPPTPFASSTPTPPRSPNKKALRHASTSPFGCDRTVDSHFQLQLFVPPIVKSE